MAAQPTHAGGIVYRMRDEPEFLLITARRSPHDWVYPKGHIEHSESAEDAAVREVQEEAGVTAQIVQPLEDVTIEVAGERQVIRYFLMRSEQEGEAGEGRRLFWASADEAMRRLRHAEALASLQKALASLQQRRAM